MTIRKAHGSYAKAGNLVVNESMPADELPDALPIDVSRVPAPLARREDGTLATSEAAKAAGRLGGLTKAAKNNRLTKAWLKKLSDKHDFYPYWRAATAYHTAICEEYADFAGGTIGAGAESLLANVSSLQAQIKFLDDIIAVEKNLKKKLDLMARATMMKTAHRQSLNNTVELANRLGKNKGNAHVDPFAFIGKVAMEQYTAEQVRNGSKIAKLAEPRPAQPALEPFDIEVVPEDD